MQLLKSTCISPVDVFDQWMAQLVSFNQGLFSAADILLLDNKLSCVNRSSTLGLVLRTGFYSGISNASVLELGAP